MYCCSYCLQKLIEELKRMLEQKERFMSSVSHELRTPLNGIIGISEGMLSGCCGVLPEQVGSCEGMLGEMVSYMDACHDGGNGVSSGGGGRGAGRSFQ